MRDNDRSPLPTAEDARTERRPETDPRGRATGSRGRTDGRPQGREPRQDPGAPRARQHGALPPPVTRPAGSRARGRGGRGTLLRGGGRTNERTNGRTNERTTGPAPRDRPESPAAPWGRARPKRALRERGELRELPDLGLDLGGRRPAPRRRRRGTGAVGRRGSRPPEPTERPTHAGKDGRTDGRRHPPHTHAHRDPPPEGRAGLRGAPAAPRGRRGRRPSAIDRQATLRQA